MRRLGELDIMQNCALGAVSLWAFVEEYNVATDRRSGPLLPQMMTVYPLIVHPESRQSVMNRKFDGGLMAAAAEDRTMFADLHERVRSMVDVSTKSISLAMATQLIRYDKAMGEFFSNRKTAPESINAGEVSEFIRASRRLGRWMATMRPTQYLSLLKVRF